MGRAYDMHEVKERNAYKILEGKQERKKKQQQDLDTDGRTILKWILGAMIWAGFIRLS
jgi:hypothetical protein